MGMGKIVLLCLIVGAIMAAAERQWLAQVWQAIRMLLTRKSVPGLSSAAVAITDSV
jgi:hypothetical protein